MSDNNGHSQKTFYIGAVARNSELLAEAASHDLRLPVPTCPGWHVATLVAHLGEVHRFWTLQISSRALSMEPLLESAFESCPGLLPWLAGADSGQPDLSAIPPGLLDWFREGAREMVRAFQGIEPDETVWHWSGDNRAITHMRNQAIEACVHRWDGENAEGAVSAVESSLAVDGIDQHFEVQLPFARQRAGHPEGCGERYLLRRTDGPEEWRVEFQGGEVLFSREGGAADISLSGTAEDLFLWLWGRTGADNLAVEGDRVLLARYRKFVPSA